MTMNYKDLLTKVK